VYIDYLIVKQSHGKSFHAICDVSYQFKKHSEVKWKIKHYRSMKK